MYVGPTLELKIGTAEKVIYIHGWFLIYLRHILDELIIEKWWNDVPDILV